MLGVTVSPSQDDMLTALRAFLLSVLPADIEVISGQDNRVAEPQIGNFVVMTPIRFERLDTNLDTFEDADVWGTISGNILTATRLPHGKIKLGALLTGAGVPPMTLVTGGPADGGPGTYTLNSSLSVATMQEFHAGAKILQMNGRWTIQLDFHSADDSSLQSAATVATLFRDIYATDYFPRLPPPQNQISPFFMDEGAQRPFLNDQQQYEWRWVSEIVVGVKQKIVVAQEFAREVDIHLIVADAIDPGPPGFPPGTNPA